MSLRHRHKRRQMEARRIAEEVAQRLNPQPIDNLMQIRRTSLDDFADMLRFNHELLAKPQSKTVEYFVSMYRRGAYAVNADIDAALELRRYRK